VRIVSNGIGISSSSKFFAKVERVEWLVKKLKDNDGRGIDPSAMLNSL
jgi:hypothetical protein